MFNPSKDEVRQFFCSTWQKYTTQQALSPLETYAVEWMVLHPEYHALLSDTAQALEKEFSVAQGETNPFLHLSMHLAIAEQVAINQPIGIRPLFEQMTAALDDPHLTAHLVMDCLGETLWVAQRDQQPLNHELYLECLRTKLQRSSHA
jgi:hypothetical protein